MNAWIFNTIFPRLSTEGLKTFITQEYNKHPNTQRLVFKHQSSTKKKNRLSWRNEWFQICGKEGIRWPGCFVLLESKNTSQGERGLVKDQRQQAGALMGQVWAAQASEAAMTTDGFNTWTKIDKSIQKNEKLGSKKATGDSSGWGENNWRRGLSGAFRQLSPGLFLQDRTLCRDAALLAAVLLQTEKDWKSPRYLTKGGWFCKIEYIRVTESSTARARWNK